MSHQLLVSDYVQAFRKMMEESEDAVYRALKAFRVMTMSLRYESEEDRRLTLGILWEFQQGIALIENLTRCPHCHMVIYPDHPHRHCDQAVVADHGQSWDWYRRQRKVAAHKSYLKHDCRGGELPGYDYEEEIPQQVFLRDG